MSMLSLRDLFTEELRDLYSAENQLVKALPKMARAAESEQLRQALEEHLDQTRVHAQRIEQIFEGIDRSPKGKRCVGMEGLIKEGNETISESEDSSVTDAVLILSAQKVEHYEIASYGSVCAYAELLEESDAHQLLLKTLEEEKHADERLSEIAQTSVNAAAADRGDDDGDEDEREVGADDRVERVGPGRAGARGTQRAGSARTHR